MQTILLVLSHILLSLHTSGMMTQPTVTRCAITLGHTNDTTYATLDCVRTTVTTYAITLGHTNNTTYVIIRVPRVTPSAPECVTCADISLTNAPIHALNRSYVATRGRRGAAEG